LHPGQRGGHNDGGAGLGLAEVASNAKAVRTREWAMADVFISYKREDRAVADALDRALTASGFSCWWDTSLVAGEHFNEAIHRELAAARCVVVLWTKNSHASQWVQAEAIDGFNRRVLVAARLDDVDLQYPFGVVQTADMRGYRPGMDHPGVGEVVAGVAEKLGFGAPARPRPAHIGRSRAPWVVAAALVLVLVGVWLLQLLDPAGQLRREDGSQVASTSSKVEAPQVSPSASERQERAQTSDTRAPGEVFRDCSECPEMVVLPAGSLNLGSPDQESGVRGDSGPQRMVTLRAFAVSKYKTTFAQWDVCVADGGCDEYRPDDEGFGRGIRSVFNVSWHGAQDYVNWLNVRVGGDAYRLLSEAEWKYAFRAGTSAPHSTADTSIAAGPAMFHPSMAASPRSLAANEFGLHDMRGYNVWEWTQDCWNASYDGVPANGQPSTAGDCSARVSRGNGWTSSPLCNGAALRCRAERTLRANWLGFRIAKTI
jgi:formylglycine-generating enzyme required for sulfatase activity